MTTMTVPRLEWLRMTRSPRGLALGAVYLFFGFAGPLLAKYMAQLAKYASSDVTIVAPTPRPEHGIVNYVSQGSQTGLLVTLVVVAGVLSFDARRGLAIFYRTRAPGPFALIWPRYLASCLLAVGAYALGTAAAWAETALILGTLPADRVLEGVLLESVYLVFAVAVVAAASTVGRTTLSTVGIAIAVLLIALPLAGLSDAVGPWLPTTLLKAPAALVTGTTIGAYPRAVAVALAGSAGLLALARLRAARRDL